MDVSSGFVARSDRRRIILTRGRLDWVSTQDQYIRHLVQVRHSMGSGNSWDIRNPGTVGGSSAREDMLLWGSWLLFRSLEGRDVCGI